MSTYADGSEEKWLRAEWAKSGHKLDMGKCCIRFKRIEDVPLDVIGAAFRRVNANDYIHLYESMMKPAKSGGGRPDKAARTVEKPAARAKPVRAAKRKTRAR
jgi:hypothetical protein